MERTSKRRVTINYVIATYSGVYRKDENKEQVLNFQLHALLRGLELKRELSIPRLVKQITVVCPKPHHEEVYENYYGDTMEWQQRFAKLGVVLVFMEYDGKNEDHSYDQWIQACVAYPNFDYFLLMEDDYCIYSAVETNFDQVLLDRYQARFRHGVGYLATQVGEAHGHERYASISNGLVSKETWDALVDPMREYMGRRLIEPYPQLCFSYMFSYNKIPIEDTSETFNVVFWDSSTRTTKTLSKGQMGIPLLCPVQYLGCSTDPDTGE